MVWGTRLYFGDRHVSEQSHLYQEQSLINSKNNNNKRVHNKIGLHQVISDPGPDTLVWENCLQVYKLL